MLGMLRKSGLTTYIDFLIIKGPCIRLLKGLGIEPILDLPSVGENLAGTFVTLTWSRNLSVLII